MRRSNVAIWLWYRGEGFHGFQVQPAGPTVQSCLKAALDAVGVERMPVPAGRTDKGVHARMQVVSLKLPASDEVESLPERLSPHLPADLGVCEARRAKDAFHAQFACAGKEYRYRVHLGRDPTARWGRFAWELHGHHRLRAARPERIAELLSRCVGTRDFHAFHESSSSRRLRTLSSATLEERGGGLLELRLRGDRFGRYQVRYLVGSAIATAAGTLSEEQLISGVERGESFPGVKAPAHGLTLWEVLYPEDLDPFAALRSSPTRLPAEPPFTAD